MSHPLPIAYGKSRAMLRGGSRPGGGQLEARLTPGARIEGRYPWSDPTGWTTQPSVAASISNFGSTSSSVLPNARCRAVPHAPKNSRHRISVTSQELAENIFFSPRVRARKKSRDRDPEASRQ